MSNELLNAAMVQRLINEKGLKQKWVLERVGLKRTAGHMMLREGLLPKDDEVRFSVLQKLSTILGVEVSEMLLRLPRPRKSA
jgi:DNA-binding Xre family transcriptional regulator